MSYFKSFRDITQNNSITLHKLTIDDLDAIYEYSKEPDFQHAIMAQVTYTNTQIFIEMIIKEMHEGKRFYYAIKDTNKIIGTIGFLNIDLEKKESEIGFGISSNYWGTNIMSLCIHKLINDAFTIYKFFVLKSLLKKMALN
jgi:ribosomal-protein-alanine N-acetyltransferase